MNRDFLRRIGFFSGLSDADLDALCIETEVVTIDSGETLIQEGAPGDAAFIVLDGEFEVVKKSDAQDIVIAVRDAGEVFGEMALLDQAPRTATVRAVRAGRVLKIPGDAFHKVLSRNPSAALDILKTVSQRLRQNEALLRQSEKMAALGTMSAGLAHELNNPAAAVRRSARQLESTLMDWIGLTGDLARANLTPHQLKIVEELEEKMRSKPSERSALDPMAQSEREGALQAWLEQRAIENAWELAPALVSAGWDVATIGALQNEFAPEILGTLVRWLAAGCTAHALLEEIGMASERLSEIVQSVKAYSYLDQGPVQEVDIHQGLENTLVILRHKMKEGITVKREYAPDLPRIEAHGSELNQVWTNILDNAVDAMQGRGEVILRTCKDGDKVQVDIQDNGPGIPPEIQKRIFEPFFTTKPPGLGTGLGLHIAYTIVNNHNGRIRLTSEAGKTCFQVTLPIQLGR